MKSKDIDNLQEQINEMKEILYEINIKTRTKGLYIDYELVESKAKFEHYFGLKGKTTGKHPDWQYDEDVNLYIGRVNINSKKDLKTALIGLIKSQMDFIGIRDIYGSNHEQGLWLYWVAALDGNNKKEISLSQTFGCGGYELNTIIHPKTGETIYVIPYKLIEDKNNKSIKIDDIKKISLNKNDILALKSNTISCEDVDYLLKATGIKNKVILMNNDVDILKIEQKDIKNIDNMVKCPYCNKYTKRKLKYMQTTMLGYDTIIDENGNDITENPNIETQHVECLKCHNDFTIEKKNGKIINISK